jgi:hypothetical protein
MPRSESASYICGVFGVLSCDAIALEDSSRPEILIQPDGHARACLLFTMVKGGSQPALRRFQVCTVVTLNT